MKLFISWSGARSKLLAESLRQWLPGVINAAEPWLSSNDIDPGARWGSELASQLEQTKYGILCITAENVNAPWLLFEAGALSKYVNESRVVPLVLDIKPTDIQGPLSQFQTIQATENDINKLVTKINQAVFAEGEKSIDQAMLDKSFKLWWPQLKETIDSIPKEISKANKNERSDREILEETLELIRNLMMEARAQRVLVLNHNNPSSQKINVIENQLAQAANDHNQKIIFELLNEYINLSKEKPSDDELEAKNREARIRYIENEYNKLTKALDGNYAYP